MDVFRRRAYDEEVPEAEDFGWISWYWSLENHQFMAEIEEEYVRDSFNLYGLRQKIEGSYDDALKMILSEEYPNDDDLEDPDFKQIYESAKELYGLIHARFIIAPEGIRLMYEKYRLGIFGTWPRLKWK